MAGAHNGGWRAVARRRRVRGVRVQAGRRRMPPRALRLRPRHCALPQRHRNTRNGIHNLISPALFTFDIIALVQSNYTSFLSITVSS